VTAADAIEVSNLVVRHATVMGPLTALDCPALALPARSSTAIVGASGCGKSTLLCMLAGLAKPTQGAVHIGTTNLTDLTESRRVAFRRTKIGMVYQADNLLPFLTVAQNIRLQLALCADIEQAEARTAALLAQLGLAELADRLPDQLSGGQRSRVAVARAIVHRPAVILADEPTGALDKDNAAAVVDLLLTAQQSLRAALVIVTHDAGIAARMGRQITLRQGKIAEDTGVQHAR
jgi:putative ABC transport system ATP-binding protein